MISSPFQFIKKVEPKTIDAKLEPIHKASQNFRLKKRTDHKF